MCDCSKYQKALLQNSLDTIQDAKIKADVEKIISSQWTEKKVDDKTLESFRKTAEANRK